MIRRWILSRTFLKILVMWFFMVSYALAITGEIKSCPGKRDTYAIFILPEVRRFIKEPGHADAYENLKITFIHGHNPELFIKDDTGNIIEKVDLSKLNTKELHDLMIQKGFERKATGTLRTSK